MKPSHSTTPRSLNEACFDPAGEAFDWTRQPRTIKPALVWIAGVLVLAGLALTALR